MTLASCGQLQASSLWPWPIDTAVYDRRPDLTSAERDALDVLINDFEAGNAHWAPQAKQALHSLLWPLNDILDLMQVPERTRSMVLILLLREMRHRQLTFWAWTCEVWIEVIGHNRWTFQHGRRRPGDLRQYIMAVGYLLNGYTDLHLFCHINQPSFARKLFGKTAIDEAIRRVSHELLQWGQGKYRITKHVEPALCTVLLLNRSARLEDLTLDILTTVRQSQLAAYLKRALLSISQALMSLKILPKALDSDVKEGERFGNPDALADVPPEWLGWCQRWLATSTLAPRTRQHMYYQLLQTGRWLAKTHPLILSPEHWTRELAAEYVAAVDRMTVGEWAQAAKMHADKLGHPLSPRAKSSHLAAMRMFFRDCQEWGWIPRRFDPRRSLAAPRTLRALIAPDPRVIEDDIWAKLLWAGLNLEQADLPASSYRAGTTVSERQSWYPLEMVQALVIVWLFAGLRSDEIQRLPVGCIRWQPDAPTTPDTNTLLFKNTVCFLYVPTNKTSTAFVKPVDYLVGEAITAWQRIRPEQPAALDSKTSERVHFLFSYRGKRVGKAYLNRTIIPMLCRKAGIPQQDARGPITSHRARSTIASQLFNAKEPMSLFELQAWLGHRSPSSTQYYAKIAPARLAKAYDDADYFARNLRTIDVLLDQEAVLNGDAARGLPWKYYDLGHGYCTYDFFEQCEHRMACARCSFYRPKKTFLPMLLEKKDHLLHMKQDIPLTDLELAAVEGDLKATERLIARLIDKPTPAGPTPRQLEQQNEASPLPKPTAMESAHG
jgi:integrase